MEPTVQFLNVDVDLFGAFARTALLNGLGDAIVVLRDDEEETQGERVLSFELGGPDADLATVVSALVALVTALPEEARAAWRSAARRVFDIGIQAGLEPKSTAWTLDSATLSALVAIGVEVTVTVYGARVEE